ncbi:response regulator [Aeromonas caviae]|uniref:response regulator n=1 Tax=Aeromonas caviae TaxID=648 RepID=UPI002B46A84E|nr:response regulator [Aeromonas caviae]
MGNDILLVEDNTHKRSNIIDAIESMFHDITIHECYSFTSAWNSLLHTEYRLICLDMSLPTFDQTDTKTGGTFRAFGGRELAKKIRRRGIKTPFLFITQYKNFSENESVYSFESIKLELMSVHKEQCKGFIFYSNSSSDWKEELFKVIKECSL